jgi:hypothetical protein
MADETDVRQADRDLCRKARQPDHYGKYTSDIFADMMAVLKSGYPMHGSWGAKAAHVIERIQRDLKRAMAIGGVNWCSRCGQELVAEPSEHCSRCKED